VRIYTIVDIYSLPPIYNMRNILQILLILGLSNSLYAQKQSKQEIDNFFSDVLHDSTKYTTEDYIADSMKFKEINRNDFENSFYPKVIDTLYSNFMISAYYGKIHSDSILILIPANKYFRINEDKNLKLLLDKDTVLGIINPFIKSDKNLVINRYLKSYKSYRINKKIFNCTFLTTRKLNKLFKTNIESGWDNFHNKYGKYYTTITIPIFNESYEFAYFEWSHSCGGLCGEGFAGLYKKVEGKWKPIKLFWTWVS